MGAPVTTTRITPAGRVLKNGHSTKIALSQDPDISFWEVEVKPPGTITGDKIDLTTMFNLFWRTYAGRTLSELSNWNASALYDPNVYNNLISNVLHREGSVTIREPDGSTLDFFGQLLTADPDRHVERTAPRLNIEGCCTNRDPSDGSEAGPVLTSVSGS